MEKFALDQQLILGGGFRNGHDCKLITRGQVAQVWSLESDHEEADAKFLLHAHHASTNYPQVIVQSPDTDVAVICVHKYSVMSCQKLWFLTGVKYR